MISNELILRKFLAERVVIGKYYKIISRNINGRKYYFICDMVYGGFDSSSDDVEEVIERFRALEIYYE